MFHRAFVGCADCGFLFVCVGNVCVVRFFVVVLNLLLNSTLCGWTGVHTTEGDAKFGLLAAMRFLTAGTATMKQR